MKKVAVVLIVTLAVIAMARTAQAQESEIPDQAYVSGVAGHAQQYSLSCESRSAADWAAYWGIKIDETEFLNPWDVFANLAVRGKGSGQIGTAPASAAEGDYIVQRGDTLNKITTRLGVFWPDLAAWNHISYPYLIYPGQLLITSPNGSKTESQNEEARPDGKDTYTVQRGDLLLDVAQELDVAWLQLARLNQIAPPFLLMPGTMLQIPQELVESEVEAPDTYTATRNESLIGVALYFGQDWVR